MNEFYQDQFNFKQGVTIQNQIADYRTALKLTDDMIASYLRDSYLNPKQKKNAVQDLYINRACLYYLIASLEQDYEELQ